MVLYFGETAETLKKLFNQKKKKSKYFKHDNCKPYFEKIKDYDTTFYIHVYEILLHTTMYLSRFKTNSVFHA